MFRRLAARVGLLLLLAAVPACLGGPQTDPPGLHGVADFQDDHDTRHHGGGNVDGSTPADASWGFVPTNDAGVDSGSTDPAADFTGESPGATVPENVRPLPRQFVPPKRTAPETDSDAAGFRSGVH